MKRFHRNPPDLIKFIKSLPTCAGVYLISCRDQTTYLGATMNLQRRCHQHLSKSGRFHGEHFSVIDTLKRFNVKKLRAMENEYLRAFNFEHNSMVASPYCYTANVTSSSVA
jgi:predicted GIY-YIG superfamily endonuclease